MIVIPSNDSHVSLCPALIQIKSYRYLLLNFKSLSGQKDRPVPFNSIQFLKTKIKPTAEHDSVIGTHLDVSLPAEDFLLSYFNFLPFKPLSIALFAAIV